ncbi:MAG: acyl carrier protein [Okeania sp. SIO2F4]|uniref:acyl carrier protein n=1 Tax=Okeania sp. SIO2F4 TaxID=2607790 RepID=UPI00142A5C95|nr:acyl carrier protein [Okeania sp. SIO2F4]NES04195.1 acyl carrier protein [Okeania sp. SIO2F4]
MQTQTYQLTQAEIQEWLVSYLAEILEIDKKEVDIKEPFIDYGLDSTSAIVMTGDIGTFFGLNIDPTIPYDYQTIEALAKYLEEQKKVA